MEKSDSFPDKNNNNNNNNNATSESTIDSKPDGGDQRERVDESGHVSDLLNLPQVVEDIDRFTNTLSSSSSKDLEEEKSIPVEVPALVENLSNLVDSMLNKYEYREGLAMMFGLNQEEDDSFFDSLTRISKLVNDVGKFPSDSTIIPSLNKASIVLHRAMSFLDDEFRSLLESSKPAPPPPPIENNKKGSKSSKQLSYSSSNLNFVEPDRSVQQPESESKENEFSPEVIANMNKIATGMIKAGYETECCMFYIMARRNALNDELNKLEFKNISIDEVQKMQWESLEEEMATWIDCFKHCYSFLFREERKLCDAIFSEFPTISKSLYSELATAVILRFLNFGEAVVLTKRSAERLFKILDMYETLGDLIPVIVDTYPTDVSKPLIAEISVAKIRLGEAARSIFCELEKSIKSDQGKTPVPSGQVHPLTRYTMNYLKYACEYRDTLEQVFQEILCPDSDSVSLEPRIKSDPESSNKTASETARDREDGNPDGSPFATQLMTVMDLLDANLEMKSKLYRDPALRYVFLMNNGRYILQKIKGSMEIHDMLGVTWSRKRSTDLRSYHKNYQRETWSRVLQCLNHDGLQVSGKVHKPTLKERFKNFNALFEDIHKTQSTWVVSDEQLQSELRVSISAVVIPAYRSFLGRYKQYFEPGRQSEKYIKFQPEDIETYIDELFDGNPTSMQRRRF